MRRLIQLLKIIFSNNVYAAQEHYQHPDIISYYRDLVDVGLFSDEVEIKNCLSERKPKNLLLYGSGAGRECKAIRSEVKDIVGYDPVEAMNLVAFQHEGITYTSALVDFRDSKFDVIWVTKNLPSFLNIRERKELYRVLLHQIGPGGIIFIKPDIMMLEYSSSFRFKLASDMLRIFKTKFYTERGDTLRVNLDLYLGDDHFVFYHYFHSEQEFLNEVLSNGFKAKILSGGFFQLEAL
jgi:hypothetical protein